MIAINVNAPLRGGGTQAPRVLSGQSLRGTFAWGSNPGQASLTYIGTEVPVTVGARLDFWIGGHFFAGVCVSDVLTDSSQGVLRSLEFADLRYYLGWDWVFGAWNMPEVRLVDGVRRKRYWHIYPQDWGTQTKTFTDAPLAGWKILETIFAAPTVWAQWVWDLTGNGLFPGGLLNGAVYELDASSGMRLDGLLNLIGEKTGLVFCHDPRPGQDWRLVWTRKGYGALPLPFPANSDDRRYGWRLTENAVNVCVLGERNRYQVLNVPMQKDWAEAWEIFLDVEELVLDIFTYERGPNPKHGNAVERYNAWTGDVDEWFGYGAAAVRAREITVSQYVALRAARTASPAPAGGWAADAQRFADPRKYAGRWRMDMPAALYVQQVVFRAFRPTDAWASLTNADGARVPLTSAPIADQLLCRVLLDYETGQMTAVPNEPVDGNGVLAVKGHTFGDDLFRLAAPDRINADFWSGNNAVWSSVQFGIDDSGEGRRFVLAEQPVFVQDDEHPLVLEVDGYYMLNASFKLKVPEAKAALVLEAERYTYWRRADAGTWRPGRVDTSLPLPGRTRVEGVNGLAQEFVVDYSAPGTFTEIPFADNVTADAKAELVARTLLLNQAMYVSGGYNLKWPPNTPLSTFGTPLAAANSSCIDRLDLSVGPDGVVEVVDFTMERGRSNFEPERELERRTLQNNLFPGQQELRQYTQDQRRLNAAMRQLSPQDLGRFQRLLRGEVSADLHYVRVVPGTGTRIRTQSVTPEPSTPEVLPVGTPLAVAPAGAGTSGNATVIAPWDMPDRTETDTNPVFVGVTVREAEPVNGRRLAVQAQGDTYARVLGPVEANEGIGLSLLGGTDYETNRAYLTSGGQPSVGVALEAIAETEVRLIKVRLGTAGGGNLEVRLCDADTGEETIYLLQGSVKDTANQ